MATYATPEVYTEEFEPAAPIVGVGTSTAAFLGPCKLGPLNTPTRIDSWDQFTQRFGKEPVSGFFLWYAVRGFYQNGGRTCFITRVSNATYGVLPLADHAGPTTLTVTARQAGVLNPVPSITVNGDVHTVAAPAKLYRPTGTIAGAAAGSKLIALTAAADAEKFRPGDRLDWTGAAAADRGATVARVTSNVIEVLTPLAQTYNAGNLRLFSPAIGVDTLRVENGAALAPSMVLKLEQVPAPPQHRIVKSVTAERINGVLTTHRITLRAGLTAALDFALAADVSVESQEFTVTVTPASGTPRPYPELGMDPEHPRFYGRIVNDPEVVLAPFDPPNTTPVPRNRPATLAITALPAGVADNPATLTAADYTNALALLQTIDEVNIVAIPDRQDAAVQGALIAHCENMADRFAVLDAAAELPPFGAGSVDAQRAGLTSNRGYAALYYPWLTVTDSAGIDTIKVPPSGHVIGIYVRTDQSRGVHKAPAGTAATVSGAIGLERLITHNEQEGLNPNGINVIRSFYAGGRPTVWGARTTASGYNGNANWQYVNIRRLFLYLEESIQEGLRGAIFEPNNRQLWQKLKRTLTDFLTRNWREGALFGDKATGSLALQKGKLVHRMLQPLLAQRLLVLPPQHLTLRQF